MEGLAAEAAVAIDNAEEYDAVVRQAQSPTIRTQAIHVASPAEAQHLVATGVQQGAWVVEQIENIAAEPQLTGGDAPFEAAGATWMDRWIAT